MREFAFKKEIRSNYLNAYLGNWCRDIWSLKAVDAALDHLTVFLKRRRDQLPEDDWIDLILACREHPQPNNYVCRIDQSLKG